MFFLPFDRIAFYIAITLKIINILKMGSIISNTFIHYYCCRYSHILPSTCIYNEHVFLVLLIFCTWKAAKNNNNNKTEEVVSCVYSIKMD